MKKTTKFTFALTALAALSGGMALAVKKAKNEHLNKTELLDSVRLYEEYAGTDDTHIRTVIAKNGDKKWVIKSSCADCEETSSISRTLTEKEIESFRKFLEKEMKYAVSFECHRKPFEDDTYDAYTRLLFNTGAEFELGSAICL